jgi:hypothetical protein
MGSMRLTAQVKLWPFKEATYSANSQGIIPSFLQNSKGGVNSA